MDVTGLSEERRLTVPLDNAEDIEFRQNERFTLVP